MDLVDNCENNTLHFGLNIVYYRFYCAYACVRDVTLCFLHIHIPPSLSLSVVKISCRENKPNWSSERKKFLLFAYHLNNIFKMQRICQIFEVRQHLKHEMPFSTRCTVCHKVHKIFKEQTVRFGTDVPSYAHYSHTLTFALVPSANLTLSFVECQHLTILTMAFVLNI